MYIRKDDLRYRFPRLSAAGTDTHRKARAAFSKHVSPLSAAAESASDFSIRSCCVATCSSDSPYNLYKGGPRSSKPSHGESVHSELVCVLLVVSRLYLTTRLRTRRPDVPHKHQKLVREALVLIIVVHEHIDRDLRERWLPDFEDSRCCHFVPAPPVAPARKLC